MKRAKPVSWLVALAIVFTSLLAGFQPVGAQGVTTAAVSGRVTDPDGNPLASVEIRVVNQATGVAHSVVTNANGNYLVPGLQVGGPYRIEVHGLGYAEETRAVERLTLGQNLQADFRLSVQAIAVEGISVNARVTGEQVINPNRTGAEQLVTEHQLQSLPTINRDFTDFIAISPLTGAGGGATSVGQQNNRFNNIQIDGALNQDLFGLGSTGQPGGQAGARSIALDAVKEYQVLAAPFDVRQSGFTGGLINAVTKSGTNELHGSFYSTYKNQDFVRKNLVVGNDKIPFGDFTNKLYGASLGGRIIRDKMHFFVSGEWEDESSPAGDIAIGRESPATTGVSPTDAQQFATLLSGKGVDPGTFGARSKENPNRNVFARVDAQLSPIHSLTVRHNFVHAEDDIPVNRGGGSSYSFDSNWYTFKTTTNSSVVQLNSAFRSGLYNELTFAFNSIRDRRSPNTVYPDILVSVPNAGGAGTKTLIAGAEYFSQGNELDQDSWEFTDNLNLTKGNHRITVGAHNELFKFRNLFYPGETGEWRFSSLNDFAAGTPNSYRRSVPYEPGADPTARFKVDQISLYAQTEYTGIRNLVLTAGLRYDLPLVLDDPINNPAIEQAFGRRTDETASGNGIFSPRVGFNWDVHGDRSTQVRGGGGIFTGRFPYVWLSNLYSNTGLSTVTISCSGGTLPAFTIDPNNQPSTCLSSGTPASPTAVINLINPGFQYPHNWRFDLAVDHQLPYGVVGTAEVLYTRAVKQILLRELNVDFAHPVSTTQGGRKVYGTHQAGPLASGASNTNLATPNRLSDAALAVVEVGNSNKDRAYSLTLQAQKRYADGLELNTSYTYSQAKDVSGLTSSIATSNIGFNPVTGSPNNPDLATSDYETRHKIVFSGSYDLARWFSWSVFYVGNSGDGYTYTYDGDVNADGYEAFYASGRNNDLIYVPTGPGDITLTDPADYALLNSYIEGEKCLRDNRGEIIARNVCKEPWRNRVDTRFTFKLPTRRAQHVDLTFDVLNVLNLVNSDWGRSEGVPFPTISLLELRGWDNANNRGIFRPTSSVRLVDGKPATFTTFDPASRWQAQVGLRYTF